MLLPRRKIFLVRPSVIGSVATFKLSTIHKPSIKSKLSPVKKVSFLGSESYSDLRFKVFNLSSKLDFTRT
jgi:hypothetical protein